MFLRMDGVEKMNISATTLRKILRYDPETGKLFWRERDDCPKQWNTRYASKEAFTADTSHGYKHGKINGKVFRAHRVIWALAHGKWPEQAIDHINGVRNDNRIENLRIVSASENMKNMRLPRDNSSGIIGVRWCKRSNKWLAAIRSNGSYKHLGYFIDIADAISARKTAEQQFRFHENHGRK